MAVDLSCYASKSLNDVEHDLHLLRSKHPELLSSKFIIYPPRAANAIKREIVAEYGLDAQTVFLVSLDDKDAANLVVSVVEMLKQTLGKKTVVILHGNSVRM